MRNVLVWLRVGLHLCFASLLGFALLSAASWPMFACGSVLGLLYLAGTVWEHRFAKGQWRADPNPYAVWWLHALFALWALGVWLDQSFVWLMFPLVFLTLQLSALWEVVGLWLVATLLPQPITQSQVIGPLFGAVFAVAIHHIYVLLNREVNEHKALAQQLMATRDSLAVREHEAGRLEERERLSREIHDTVAQGLSSIVLVSRALRGSLATGDLEAARRHLDVIEEQASSNLNEARRFVRDLADTASLAEAGKALAQRVMQAQLALGHRIEIETHIPANVALPEELRTAVLRAMQEGLNNVAKHAQASRAVLTLSVWEEAVALDVVDNGVGTAAIPGKGAASGYGLVGLRRRIEALGGTMRFEQTSEGSTLSCFLPIQ